MEVLHAYRESVRPAQDAALEALFEYGLAEVGAHLPSGIARFAATAAAINADVSSDWRLVFDSLQRPLAPLLYESLKEPVCDLDLCWLRTQFPPRRRPTHQAPHNWHQDGACGVNFSSADTALAPMLTAWVPLESCGRNAPSIEVVVDSPRHLLELDQLTNPLAAWRELPTQSLELNAGDAVLMAGHCVHRTHVTSDMSQARNCVEFRFLDQCRMPSRFRKHRFV